MNRIRHIRSYLGAAALLLALAMPLVAEPMGVSNGHDLDRLWSTAKSHFDLSMHDAVILLESRHVSLLQSGHRLTRIHRVVWISTEVGIDDHADLRIPYNSATSTMKVTVLRTWRDGRWWPDRHAVSPTAVVETLPFAVARADDYTPMREMMLLHDGVEIPCIMETAYEIEEQLAAQEGSEGTWVFPQPDPAALVEYVLSVPRGTDVVFRCGNGAPQPEVSDDDNQMVTYAWRMENLDRLGSPRIVDPAGYAPYVAWSTWNNWNTLGRAIVSSFDGAAVLTGPLAGAITDTLAGRLEHEPTTAAKARAVAALVEEFTRGIHYDCRFCFLSPRPAPRTWETAYGHGLDRAVLAAALLREAGLHAEALFRSTGYSGIDTDVPGLSRFDEIMVHVSGDRLEALYDPLEGSLSEGQRPLYGRTVWRLQTGNAPSIPPDCGGPEATSRFELILTLKVNEETSWSGNGFLYADGLFCPYAEMAGLSGEGLEHIKSIAHSVLEGADVTVFNPEAFERTLVTAGFDFTVKARDPDARGRTCIVIGDPAGGVLANLPPDVRLYHEHRDSPVILPSRMTQRMRLRIEIGGREIVHLPQARTLENGAGHLKLGVESENGWVTIDRELTLEAVLISPGAWPQLRALLLEETDTACRTILMK